MLTHCLTHSPPCISTYPVLSIWYWYVSKNCDTRITNGEICLTLSLPGSAIAESGRYTSKTTPKQSYNVNALTKLASLLIQFPTEDLIYFYLASNNEYSCQSSLHIFLICLYISFIILGLPLTRLTNLFCKAFLILAKLHASLSTRIQSKTICCLITVINTICTASIIVLALWYFSNNALQSIIPSKFSYYFNTSFFNCKALKHYLSW